VQKHRQRNLGLTGRRTIDFGDAAIMTSILTPPQIDAIQDALRLGTYHQKAQIDDLHEKKHISELTIRLERDLFAKFEVPEPDTPAGESLEPVAASPSLPGD
jgi:hypothetical protein